MPTLTWLGHSAFLLQDGDATVAIDPFLTGNPMASTSADAISPQTILLTHAHNDHVGDTVSIARRTGAKTVSTFELGEWLEGQGVKNAVAANHGGTVRFEGGSVKLVPAWHTSTYNDGGKIVAPGVPAGLIVRMGNRTIYFAGDTCLFGDMKLIGDEGLDVAVVPIGDHFTMGPTDAARAAEFLRAGIVVPCHYNTFPPIQQDPQEFRRLVESQTTSRCVVLAPGESIEV